MSRFFLVARADGDLPPSGASPWEAAAGFNTQIARCSNAGVSRQVFFNPAPELLGHAGGPTRAHAGRGRRPGRPNSPNLRLLRARLRPQRLVATSNPARTPTVTAAEAPHGWPRIGVFSKTNRHEPPFPFFYLNPVLQTRRRIATCRFICRRSRVALF